ncbi:MAG: transglycosylase domain-containing protein [Bacteriovorax sp.]|nr:transglycosylase domain-containing protein [Bacteriovorax sp.]
METASNNTPKTVTFADKFSKFKIRFFMAFWLIAILILIKISLPLFSTYYSISKFQEHYFTILVIDNHAVYTEVDSRPPTWVPLEKISKRVQQAIISSEDGKFYFHPGYDLEQLRDAINDSFVLKKKMRGASTITQQLVKNLYLSRDKTFGRKARELVMALMIEKHSNKQKILEAYLNIIEYGKDLYGIDKASRYYFNKPPGSLNSREAAFLAMLLPSPVKYSKSFKNKSLTPFARRMIDSILLKMRQAGYISEEEYITQLNGRFSWEKNPSAEEILDEQISGSEEEEKSDD